ncbi:phage tail fiber protein [Pectobacterium carotovorum]|uniref:phage tail fiber protein n=1 Tax=Pectobacterium carotovorum TaxID=554 RepID=UPI0020BD5FAF|nr:prophage tail fiber N-terminal domain-containing protein [Pectobacterium carotovorum]
MSVLISGVLINPAGIPVSGAEITFTALTTSDSVLNGFSASTVTNDDGEYAVPLEHCVYSIAIQSDGYNSIYGSVSINEKSTPTTINELLKLATMEQTVTPAIIVYFREIQTDVAVKLATMQTLSNNATTAARDATTARNEAAQYAQSLSAAVTQAQQASAAATASANTATTAKNAAETAAGNAQATLAGAMKKSANGLDIDDVADFRNNLGLKSAATHDVQGSSIDATTGRVLKIANNGAGPFGLGSAATMLTANDIVVQLRSAVDGWYRCPANTVRAPSVRAWTFHVMKWDDNTRCVLAMSTESGEGVSYMLIKPNADSGWVSLWDSNNLQNPATLNTTQAFTAEKVFNAGFLDHRSTMGRIQSPLPVALTSLSQLSAMRIGDVLFINGNNSTAALSPTGTSVGYWHIACLGKSDAVSTSGTFIATQLGLASNCFVGTLITGTTLTWTPIAARRVQSGTTDTTGGALMAVGAFGLGAQASLYSDANTPLNSGVTQFIRSPSTGTAQSNWPADNLIAWRGINLSWDANSATQMAFRYSSDVRAYVRTAAGSNNSGWLNVLLSNQYTVDASGNYKTASPVINIYADGSFTATDEAEGVNVERLGEGVYKITGCQGMHPDAAWNGIDGGVSNPKCRNDKALLWNNYEVDEDGSVTVYTFHRVHTDAMPFAQNRLTLDKEPFDAEKGHTPEMEWPDQTPIDVPRGAFIQVRVNMPERSEPKPIISNSNVYCNTISSAIISSASSNVETGSI